MGEGCRRTKPELKFYKLHMKSKKRGNDHPLPNFSTFWYHSTNGTPSSLILWKKVDPFIGRMARSPVSVDVRPQTAQEPSWRTRSFCFYFEFVVHKKTCIFTNGRAIKNFPTHSWGPCRNPNISINQLLLDCTLDSIMVSLYFNRIYRHNTSAR